MPNLCGLYTISQILPGKQLFDTLEQKATPKDALAFLKAADLLDFKPAIEFAARILITKPIPNLNIMQLAQSGQISEYAKQMLTRYTFLITGKELGIDKKYTVSLQDYLDYQPEIFGRRKQEAPTYYEEQKRLDLSHLALNDLKGLNKIPGIEQVLTLDLGNNNIQEISTRDFIGLQNLKELYLDNNEIISIPDIEPFQNLIVLTLSNNQIGALPNTINFLRNLTGLDLDANNIDQIPPIISQFPHLIMLRLANNRITNINVNNLTPLINLRLLILFGNPLSEVNINALRTTLPETRIVFTPEENEQLIHGD